MRFKRMYRPNVKIKVDSFNLFNDEKLNITHYLIHIHTKVLKHNITHYFISLSNHVAMIKNNI